MQNDEAEIASRRAPAMTVQSNNEAQMEEKIPSQKLFAVTNEEKIPMMLTFMFGEAARVAQRGAAERLLRWCRARSTPAG